MLSIVPSTKQQLSAQFHQLTHNWTSCRSPGRYEGSLLSFLDHTSTPMGYRPLAVPEIPGSWVSSRPNLREKRGVLAGSFGNPELIGRFPICGISSNNTLSRVTSVLYPGGLFNLGCWKVSNHSGWSINYVSWPRKPSQLASGEPCWKQGHEHPGTSSTWIYLDLPGYCHSRCVVNRSCDALVNGWFTAPFSNESYCGITGQFSGANIGPI